MTVEVQAKATYPDDVAITVTATMPLRSWRKATAALDAAPYHGDLAELKRGISTTIENVSRTFKPTE